MKNLLKSLAIIAFVAAIGFSFAACDGGGGIISGRLTVTGTIPGHTLGAAVYANVMGELTMNNVGLAMQSPQAVSIDTSSPFSLDTFPTGGVFTRSGTFMVIIPAAAGELLLIPNVQFTNGSATIRASDLVRFSDLPLGSEF